MKNFNYTARDRAGATKHGSIKASDRNAALHELAAQGMVPISVFEGPALKQARGQAIPFKYLVYAMTCLVICVLIFAWSQMKPVKSKSTTHKKVQQKTAQVKSNYVASNTVKTNKVNDRENIDSQKVLITNRVVETNEPSIGYATNRRIRVNSILPDGTVSNVPPRLAFDSPAERALNVIANTQPGMPIPPLMIMPTGQEFIDALNKGIVVYDDEPETAVDKKANVAHAKEILKEYIDKGGKPEDFLTFYRKELLNQFNERRLANIEMNRIAKEEGEESALKYADEQNKSFAERGIKKLQLTKKNPETE
jgi:hypothetical protein